MPETYPLVISKLPVTVNHHDVLAWVRTPRLDGEYPGGYVLAHNPAEFDPFVTWNVYTKDGGETWDACWGHYFSDLDDAWLDFTARARPSIPACQ